MKANLALIGAIISFTAAVYFKDIDVLREEGKQMNGISERWNTFKLQKSPEPL
ncbi:hypothetical protein BHY07_06625 [Bacillus subtilis subsp. subtilis]|uniref:Uncharacterized protein n=2 Tax=Bacillus subtilis subsp. subtilis TaxID=135461 RepID=A0A6M3ZIH2_BACSU|nr:MULTISPECIES: hypothetical protein [Bacillus]AHA77177.1 Hypothetical Protein U712_06150 [Bacillus subtilis PY79]AKE23047.1 hypothetical protein BsLM_1248 [Bacillus sp. LM 4-2]BAM50113.1 hypothetical protein BEST7613_1182 [Bacillus subtilis BEST7613]BAM57381.1 hypothetical protein BEST7003_1180 [Bacillus subtilis BEST7003]AIC39581.1 hypothetical protein BSUA_01295 [Bacillus subtilis subsp. subtilis str. JH642 substr. AG174]